MTGNVSPLTEIVSTLALANGSLTAAGITQANTTMRNALQNLLGEGTVTMTPGAVMTDLSVIDLTSLGEDFTTLTSENLVIALFAAMTAAMVGSEAAGADADLGQNDVFARLAGDLAQDGVFSAELQADIDASLTATKLQVRSVLISLLQSGAFDGTAAAEVLTNLDATSLALLLSPAKLPLPEAGDALGTGAVSYDALTGNIAIEATFSDVTPTRVELRLGHAGETGDTLLALRQGSDGTWFAPVGTVLDADSLAALAAGRLHLFAATADRPTGALRGQLPAPGIGSIDTALTNALVLPQRSTAANAHLFITADERDETSQTWQFHATTDAADVTGFRIMLGEPGTDGTVLFELTADAELPGHWSATRTDDVVTLRNARVLGQLFAEAVDGEGVLLRGQIIEAADSVFPGRVLRSSCATNCDAGIAAITLDDDRADFVNVTLTAVDGVPQLGFLNGRGEFELLTSLEQISDGHWRADVTLDALALARLRTAQLEIRTLDDDGVTGRVSFDSTGPRGLTVDTTLSGAEIVGGSSITEHATATLIAPAAAGAGLIDTTVPTSLSPLAVEIRVALAGTEGEVWATLTEDAAAPGQ